MINRINLTKNQLIDSSLSVYNKTGLMQVRINKLLADLGVASRRGADSLIGAGKVLINGRRAKLGEKVDLVHDQLKVSGKTIDESAIKALTTGEKLEYWLLNKPPGVVSTVSDDLNRQTVMRFLANKSQARLYPVGRLDFESEGLLLMTNDGELTHRLTHPKYAIEKEYLVSATGIFSEDKINRLQRGVLLAGKRVRADHVELVSRNARNLELKFILHEGRKREVRRLCARVGWEVTRLIRLRLAQIQLADLKPGTVRKLSDQEIKELKKSVQLED